MAESLVHDLSYALTGTLQMNISMQEFKVNLLKQSLTPKAQQNILKLYKRVQSFNSRLKRKLEQPLHQPSVETQIIRKSQTIPRIQKDILHRSITESNSILRQVRGGKRYIRLPKKTEKKQKQCAFVQDRRNAFIQTRPAFELGKALDRVRSMIETNQTVDTFMFDKNEFSTPMKESPKVFRKSVNLFEDPGEIVKKCERNFKNVKLVQTRRLKSQLESLRCRPRTTFARKRNKWS